MRQLWARLAPVSKRFRDVVARAERGATAVVVAVSMLALTAAAAVGVDLARVAFERQVVRDSIDAAAQYGSGQLTVVSGNNNGINLLIAAVKQVAVLNYGRQDNEGQMTADKVSVNLMCVVRANSGAPDTTQIGAGKVCNPGSYTAANWICSTTSCAIQCAYAGTDSARDYGTDSCNSLKVSYNGTLKLVFGPAVNPDKLSTWPIAATSLSCFGSCGATSVNPNPMDVVVVADRTLSMKANLGDKTSGLIGGIRNMLATMTPKQQFVALGTLHKSATGGSCASAAVAKANGAGNWMATGFSDNYRSTVGGVLQNTVNDTDPVVAAVNCLPLDPGTNGTWLAAGLKGAARTLLGLDKPYPTPSDLPSYTDRASAANALKVPVKKVIIFETDGNPVEINNTPNATDLGTLSDPNSTDANTACNNFKTVAANAKAAGILIITIAFGDAATNRCDGSAITQTQVVDSCSYQWVLTGYFLGVPLYSYQNVCTYKPNPSDTVPNVMAAVASPKADGTPSLADHDCSSPDGITAENSDGDYFFCASSDAKSPDGLTSVFATALGTISSSTKFMSIGDSD